jgi:dihydrofolate reductase
MGNIMNVIVAVDKKWGIGYQNKLLVRIPADQRFFRHETTGKAVIMGRKTLESFPGGQPLKNRLNVVLTADMNYKAAGTVVVHSVEEALKAVEEYKTEDVYVIGGASVYKQMLPFCNTAHVTKIDYDYLADSYFPNLDEDKKWRLTGDSDEQTYFDLVYTFCRYERMP